MSDKMLVTQALDERDLLVKKIQDKIAKACKLLYLTDQLFSRHRNMLKSMKKVSCKTS